MLDYSELVPYLVSPYAPDWFWIVAVGFFISCAFVALGFLTFLVVLGMYKAESWSWTAAIALPLVVITLNLIHVLLLVFTPDARAHILELGEAANAGIVFLAWSVVYLVLLFVYLTRPHVQQYFNRVPAPTAPVPAPPVSVATTEENRFCRHCGAENKTDAVFCEKCGKKIG